MLQLPGTQRKASGGVPSFANHTPRAWEIAAAVSSGSGRGGSCPSQFPRAAAAAAGPGGHPSSLLSPSDMVGADMTFGSAAGPHPTSSSSAIMGQASSSSSSAARQRHHYNGTRRATNNSAIFRQDSIVREVEDLPLPALSREDSWSMHYDRTDQAPYCAQPIHRPRNDRDGDTMMTSTSLLHLPRENASADLAYFLRTTGPIDAPHRRPTKLEQHPRRAVSAPKNALKFLRMGGGQRRKVQNAHERLNGVLRDEGGLLEEAQRGKRLPPHTKQKVSSTGKPYLALTVPPPEEEERDRLEDLAGPSILSPDILESRVSVCFHEGSQSSDVLDSWLSSLNKQHQTDHHGRPSTDDQRPATSYEEVATRLAKRCPTPIRPAASSPPTPEPHSAVSMADSYQTEFMDRRPVSAMSIDTERAGPSSDPHHGAPLTPKISLPNEEFPVKHPSPEKEVEIKHPLPRRLGSHPVLLQRASSIASTLYPSRSVSDSPGPPPPRSPLRLRRDPRTIESIMNQHVCERKSTPKIAPSIRTASDFDFGAEPIRATVTTECSGPIKRPKSRTNGSTGSPQRRPYAMTRKEREERVRARKARDRPAVSRTIDSIVHAPAQATRQRLKKMRPQIQIPDLRPHYPLRAPSAASRVSASSTGSWRKVTQSTQTPISPVPSRASEFSDDDKTGYTPISPTASAEARAAQAGMELSPVMLVAEEVPMTRTKATPKPARLILKDGKKTYAPRPRSASVPKSVFQRRSRQSFQNSTHSSPRSRSPGKEIDATVGAPVDGRLSFDDRAPPLPSPPPTKALPPTPPASGSEKQSKANSKAKMTVGRDVGGRELETLHSLHGSPAGSSSSKHGKEKLAHVATQRKTGFKAANRAASRIDARLEALEKQNALLSAALMAVLKTNGALNGPVPGLGELEPSPSKGPMAWESRVARRSAATSHTASSSNGSALEMYMSTRRGSRHGG